MYKVVNPSFLLVYTPQIFDPKFGVVKPEGSLGLIYLASALRDKNFQVSLLDATVGNDNFTLEETFYREEKQPNGMIRVGMEIKDILKEGDIYQINHTHRLEGKTGLHPRELFQRIIQKNRVDFLSYIEGDGFEILSASPERFIRINEDQIETYPVKDYDEAKNTYQKSFVDNGYEGAILRKNGLIF